jgi:hypothetical protein
MVQLERAKVPAWRRRPWKGRHDLVRTYCLPRLQNIPVRRRLWDVQFTVIPGAKAASSIDFFKDVKQRVLPQVSSMKCAPFFMQGFLLKGRKCQSIDPWEGNKHFLQHAKKEQTPISQSSLTNSSQQEKT